MPRLLMRFFLHIGPLYRVIGRLSLWRRICFELRPNSFTGRLGLVGSAMLDSLASVLDLAQFFRRNLYVSCFFTLLVSMPTFL